MTKHILMNIRDAQGYAPDQVEDTVTLGELLEAIEAEIEQHGADAKVILHAGGGYGANYGGISRHGDIFQIDEDEDEDGYLD